jgi:uncharacterized membrane protein
MKGKENKEENRINKLTLLALLICFIMVVSNSLIGILSRNIGGSFRDIWSAASPWVTDGIIVLAVTALFVLFWNISKNKDKES